MTVKSWFVSILICLIFTGNAFADKILMKNGNRLQGTVESVKDGVLTLTTDFSEPIKMQVTQIKKILTSSPSPGIKNDDFQWLLSLGYAF